MKGGEGECGEKERISTEMGRGRSDGVWRGNVRESCMHETFSLGDPKKEPVKKKEVKTSSSF